MSLYFGLMHPGFMRRFIDIVLKPLKAHFDVNVILFIRPQTKLIESLYLQHVRLGLTQNIETYLSNLRLKHFSWLQHIELFSPISTTSTCIVIPFLPTEIKKIFCKNFAELFLESCGLSLKVPEDKMRVPINVSPIPELLDIMIYANKTMPKELAYRVCYNLTYNFKQPAKGQTTLLNEDHISTLISLFEHENEELISSLKNWHYTDAFSMKSNLN